jgi:hypothetical protein
VKAGSQVFLVLEKIKNLPTHSAPLFFEELGKKEDMQGCLMDNRYEEV